MRRRTPTATMISTINEMTTAAGTANMAMLVELAAEPCARLPGAVDEI